jgi:hypothetical protein
MPVSVALVLAIGTTLLTGTQASPPPAARPVRILFIGNSLSYSNDGLWTHLTRLTAGSGTTVETGRAAFPGEFFKSLWERREPQRAIRSGRWDVVVLQEDLPETRVADFKDYGRRFVDDVRVAGARPVLLMAWSYPRLGWITQEEIATAHREMGRELAVPVAPVGLAWQSALSRRPTLALYAGDREHPTMAGTYLATAVVYATVFNSNPEMLEYRPGGISADEAAFLRRIAWEAVQRWANDDIRP